MVLGGWGRQVADALPGVRRSPWENDSVMASKVPQDGAQGLKEVDPDDEVEATEVKADSRDGERVSTNHHGHMVSDALTGKTITISNSNLKLLAATGSKAQIAHGSPLEVVVHRAHV
jgi:hypothetical protein